MTDKREIFINKAIAVHGNKYDYSKVELKKAHDKICIICPEHGEFWQDQYSHLNGHGCPECAKKNKQEKKYTNDQYIEKCKRVWGNKYTYEHTVYNGITKFLTITCPIHGDFRIRANDFLNGHGCQKCVKKYRPSTDEWIKMAREVHGNIYNYSKVEYVNNRTKVCIICPEHGEFWQTPSRHLAGDRCPRCFKNEKKTTEQFVDEAKKVHGDKYDYSKVIYNGNKNKIEIICPKHGSFYMAPLYHLQGQGCIGCYNEHRGESTRKTQEQFVNELKEIYCGKDYDFSKINYVNSNKKVTIVCPKHGEFEATPNHIITRGDSCPYCCESRLEEKINRFLLDNSLLFMRQKKFDWMGNKSLDFFIPRYNLGIECQGEQHFKPVEYFGGEKSFNKQVKYDITKNSECEENGITLIYVIDNKNNIDYTDPMYNGIYKNNIYNINELEEKLKTLC